MDSPIPRFQRVDDRLATAAQPAPADLGWLKAQGFQAVVNLSTPTARNFVSDEARLALEAGLDYVHAPVDCSRLEPGQYEVVRGVLDALRGKKVLLHCAGNVKSSAMAHLYQVKALGRPAAPLRAELEAQGWHEPKWFAYFDSLGA
jgi:uncharacterized protein (TIGR01244 family)